MPWESFTPSRELVPEQEYYCVATWGVLSLTAAPAFWTRTGPINASLANLPAGQCVGTSRSIKLVWPFNFVAETLTVWHDRKFSKEFFKCGAHKEAMEALRGRVEFRAHRVWVTGSDVPMSGDYRATSTFWTAVKTGQQFREVV
eukprot:CAMPEP_0197848234 /NCGR_PEP_ID=MMETSP1438-20131217/7998_1 /TAXON_ID=1461541 /ORGANISM="Pterosperma sp., Strain CCMP1384" /LENGTH=143 /DNA_ID=CAMNT_0043460377 /DNA_START=555 /DNA_END=986 /DNA_ORIENTATION=-